jgi:hypothetical protein
MAKTAFETFSDELPMEREFHLPMIADATGEVGVEIDTDIPAGAAIGWQIYGVRYHFQNIASPFARINPHAGFVVGHIAVFQLCRGELPATPVLLSGGDDGLILEDIMTGEKATAVGGQMTFMYPRMVMHPAVTQMAKLYAMYQTVPDNTVISLTTIELFGAILYHLVKAPNAPRERQ